MQAWLLCVGHRSRIFLELSSTFRAFLPALVCEQMLAALSAATASYHLDSSACQPRHGAFSASARQRAPLPTLGFFESMQEGFAAGMKPGTPAEESTKASTSPSFFEAIKKSLINAAPTAEERVAARVRAGEGVVWSADFSRAWMSKKGMPIGEVSVAEALEISEELSLPVPPEVQVGRVD